MSLNEKIKILGSHRYDLLNSIGKEFYSDKVMSIKNLFGNFMLFNDNLAVDRATGLIPNEDVYSQFQASRKELSNGWNEFL